MTVHHAICFSILALLLFFYYVGMILLNRHAAVRYIFPSRPQKPVPWDAGDATLIALVFFFLPGVVFGAFQTMPESAKPAFLRFSAPSFASEPSGETDASDVSADGDHRLKREHPLTQLLFASYQNGPFGMVLFLSFLTGVVAAPIVEEFVFRVVIQGAVKRYFFGEETNGGGSPPRGHDALRAVMVVVLPAILFAVIHARSARSVESAADLENLFWGIAATLVSLPLTLLFGVVWLRAVRGATAESLGWDKNYFVDFLRGLCAFGFFLPLMFLIQGTMSFFFPEAITDPVPIFALSIFLGLLFWRTSRIASPVGMHCGLNFFSFLAILGSIYSKTLS